MVALLPGRKNLLVAEEDSILGDYISEQVHAASFPGGCCRPDGLGGSLCRSIAAHRGTGHRHTGRRTSLVRNGCTCSRVAGRSLGVLVELPLQLDVVGGLPSSRRPTFRCEQKKHMARTEFFQKLVAIDVETSGINPFRHHILSLALVPLDPSKSPLELYVNDGEPEWQRIAANYFEEMAA